MGLGGRIEMFTTIEDGVVWGLDSKRSAISNLSGSTASLSVSKQRSTSLASNEKPKLYPTLEKIDHFPVLSIN